MRAVLAVLLLAVPACATPAAGPPAAAPSSSAMAPAGRDPARRYEVTTTVLESAAHGPELCVGGVRDSLPPQCGGVPVEPFSWADVEGEESVSGTTWADGLRLVGTFDGTTFHPTEPPAPGLPPAAPGSRLESPCPVPPGGWAVVDADKVSGADQDAAVTHARSSSDVAGVWLTWPDGPPRGEVDSPARAVLNLAFTGDLARHEREARERWGGALCVTRLPRSFADLERVSARLFALREEAAAAGVHVYGGGTREVENDVQVSVLVADEVSRRWVDERFGDGWVVLSGIFRPVG